MFMLLGVFALWTYTVVPDIQTSLVALENGVDAERVKWLWIIGIAGTAVLFYWMYNAGELPS